MLAFLFPATAAPPLPQPWATGTSLSVVQVPEPGEVHPPSYGIYRTCYGKTMENQASKIWRNYIQLMWENLWFKRNKNIYIYVYVDNCRYSYWQYTWECRWGQQTFHEVFMGGNMGKKWSWNINNCVINGYTVHLWDYIHIYIWVHLSSWLYIHI